MVLLYEAAPDLDNIMYKVETLRPGAKVVYWRGTTGFMVGHRREKEWVEWVSKMNRCGWVDFVQRKVGYTQAGGEGLGVYEYIARARHTQRAPVKW